MAGINTLKEKDNTVDTTKITKATTENASTDLEKILVADTQKFLNKFFSPVIENLWVPGYYFDEEMIKELFSEKGITMIDFKETLYHKSTFLGEECMELDEESYGENKKNNYKARINEATKQIEIYMDGGDKMELICAFSYNQNPNKDGFDVLKRLNTLYKQNGIYEYACKQIGSSRRLLYRFNDRERNKRDRENMATNFDTLKDLDHTIKMKDEKYKDFMLQLMEFAYLNKSTISQLHQYMSREYFDGSIEKIKEMDDLAEKKIHLFDKFPGYDNMTYSRGAFEILPAVRPYILLKFLQLKAEGFWEIEEYADYIGSIETEDMDPNDERIKEVNLGWGAKVARFMAD